MEPINNPIIEKALIEYNKKADVYEEYVSKFSTTLFDDLQAGKINLDDATRILGYTIARVCAVTMYTSEEDFKKDMASTGKWTSEFLNEVLKRGKEEANPDDFRINKLTVFAGTYLDQLIWNLFYTNFMQEEGKRQIEEMNAAAKESKENIEE